MGSPAASAGRPAERAHRVRVEAPGRAGARGPRGAAVLGVGGVQLAEAARVTVDDEHVPVADEAAPPSIGASGGNGYGPGSLSSSYENDTGTRGCVPGTVVYGMPIGPPSHVPEPKSAFSPAVAPMLATQPADCGWTGRADTSACQKESGGVMGHAGAPGTGLPSARAAATSATSTRIEVQAVRRVPVTLAP